VRDVFIASLLEAAKHNPRVYLITGDLGFAVFDRYRAELPGQFLNAGVAEQNMTAIATGMALEGRTVFTYSIANFPILRCLEQIRNDAAYHDANVKVVSIGGGFSYGALGMSHHATEDIAILRSLPAVTVVVPGDDWETHHATKAIIKRPGVCYLRLDKSSAGDTHAPGEEFEIGKARVLRRGTRVAIVACGGILAEALKAADKLTTEGVSTTVASIHTVKPIDRETLIDLARTHEALVTLEEHSLNGGLGSAVLEVLGDAGVMPRRFRRLGIASDQYVSEVGSQEYLRARCGIDSPGIIAAVRELLA